MSFIRLQINTYATSPTVFLDKRKRHPIYNYYAQTPLPSPYWLCWKTTKRPKHHHFDPPPLPTNPLQLYHPHHGQPAPHQ